MAFTVFIYYGGHCGSSVLVLKTSSNTTIELQRNIILNFFNQPLNFFTSFSRANTFKPPFQVRSGIH